MILILKTGHTIEHIRPDHGDFEDWIAGKMQLSRPDYVVHPVGDYQQLPPEGNYSGVVITGSPLMVTDLAPRESLLGQWILEQQEAGLPLLGICFGHHLLNVLNGGSVGYNSLGNITGCEKTYLTKAGEQDILLGALPPVFEVYKSHQQSVQTVPEFASVLSKNHDGIIDAIRFGKHSWAVQFHPEFDAEITTLHIQDEQDELKAQGKDVPELLSNVAEVDYGERLLQQFRELTRTI